MERKLSDGGRWEGVVAGGSCYRHPLLWCWATRSDLGWVTLVAAVLYYQAISSVFPFDLLLFIFAGSFLRGLFACMVNRLLKVVGLSKIEWEHSIYLLCPLASDLIPTRLSIVNYWMSSRQYPTSVYILVSSPSRNTYLRCTYSRWRRVTYASLYRYSCSSSASL